MASGGVIASAQGAAAGGAGALITKGVVGGAGAAVGYEKNQVMNKDAKTVK